MLEWASTMGKAWSHKVTLVAKSVPNLRLFLKNWHWNWSNPLVWQDFLQRFNGLPFWRNCWLPGYNFQVLSRCLCLWNLFSQATQHWHIVWEYKGVLIGKHPEASIGMESGSKSAITGQAAEYRWERLISVLSNNFVNLVCNTLQDGDNPGHLTSHCVNVMIKKPRVHKCSHCQAAYHSPPI